MKENILEVTWQDSARSYECFTREELLEYGLIEMRTVGYGFELVDRYVMSPEKEGNNYRYAFSIPKVNVTSVKVMK